MGLAIKQINKMAKDPEAEKLGIQVKAKEWEKALAQVSGRRGAIKATGRGVSEGTKSLVYARVVKPKIIKTLMNEVKSGNLQATNPKGYAERLKRVHDNFDELMKKEGVDYRKLSRRDLGKRVGKVMEPEINDAVTKAKDFATDSKLLRETFLESDPNISAGFEKAGIKDPKAQFLMRLIMKVNGMG
jgi:hypothetical protein